MRFYIGFNEDKYCTPQNYAKLGNTMAVYDYGDPNEEDEGMYYVDIETLEELSVFCDQVLKELNYQFSPIISFKPNQIFLTNE